MHGTLNDVLSHFSAQDGEVLKRREYREVQGEGRERNAWRVVYKLIPRGISPTAQTILHRLQSIFGLRNEDKTIPLAFNPR